MLAKQKLGCLIVVSIMLIGGSVQAAMTWVAHYDTTSDANYAAGNNPSDNSGDPASVTSGNTGKFGEALNTIGGGDHAKYKTLGNVFNAAGTIMLWYDYEADGRYVFSIGANGDNTVYDIELRCGNNVNVFYWDLMDSSGNTDTLDAIGPPAENDPYAHIAFTWKQDTSGNTVLSTYYNGVMDETVTCTPAQWSGFDLEDENMYVGAYYQYRGDNAEGYIDDVAIFDEALSDASIQNIYTSGVPVPEPASMVLLFTGVFGLLRKRI